MLKTTNKLDKTKRLRRRKSMCVSMTYPKNKENKRNTERKTNLTRELLKSLKSHKKISLKKIADFY